MTLIQFKRSHDLSLTAFAALLGYPITTVASWISGHRKPEPEHLSRIVAATGGAVTLADLRPDLAVLFAAAPNDSAPRESSSPAPPGAA